MNNLILRINFWGDNIKSLDKLKTGEKSYIKCINTKCELSKRLNDIGFVNGTEVKCLFNSPLGDPSAYLVRGAIIAMRKKDSSYIEVADKKYV